LIRVENLNFHYPNQNHALKDINLKVERGETVLITGPSGCGKSTLGMTLNGLVPHHVKGNFRGNVVINGTDAKRMGISELVQRVGLVFQNPDSQLFALSVREEAAFGPENLSVPPLEIARRIKNSLGDVEMRGSEKKNPEDLSGGQKQRVAIASVLAMEPEILIFDEPIAQLDSKRREKFRELLRRLKRKGITIIIMEHNVPLLWDLTDHLMVMDKGRKLLDKKRNDITDSDVGLMTDLGVRWEKFTLSSKRKGESSEPVINGSDISFTYQDGTEVLKGLSFEAYQGEFLGVVGENGSGKTTLLKSMMGLLKVEGVLTILGKKNPGVDDLFGEVILLFQNPEYQIFEETVVSEVAFSLKKLNLPPMEMEERVDWALNLVGIQNHHLRNPLSLSMGEKQRVALASILALKPKNLLLDEPFSNMDYGNAKRIMTVLKGLQKNGGLTIVMASHDHEILERHADRIVEIREGKC